MNRQPSLFDPVTSRQQRDSAMAATDQAHDPALKASWMDVIHAVCMSMAFFTTDDVIRLGIERGLPEPREPRVFGPWMKAAQSKNWCRLTRADTATQRVSRHRAPVRIWASRLCEGHTATCPTCRGLGVVSR